MLPEPQMQPTETDEKERDFDFDKLFAATRKLRGEKSGDKGGSTLSEDSGEQLPARSWKRSVLVLAILAIAGFYGFNSWTGKTAPGDVPTLHADVTPLKSKPADAGGEDVPFQDQTVFDRLNTADSKVGQTVTATPLAATSGEKILPAAEEPVLILQNTQTQPAGNGAAQIAPAAGQPIIAQTNAQHLEQKPSPKLESIDEPLLPPVGTAIVPGKTIAKPAASAPSQTPPVAPGKQLETVAIAPAVMAPIAPPPSSPAAALSPASAVTVAMPKPVVVQKTVADASLTMGKNADIPALAPTKPVVAPIVAAPPAALAKTSVAQADTAPPDTASSAPSKKTSDDSIGRIITNLDPSEKSGEPQTSAQATPATAATAAQKAIPAGFFRVQLASIPDQTTAKAQADRLTQQYSDALDGANLTAIRADLGTKGVYWRIQSQPMSRDAAADLCKSLKTAGATCIVVHP